MQTVITSLIAVIVSVTSTLAGIKLKQTEQENKESEGKPRRKSKVIEVNPIPVMVMIIGLVLGASLGVYARANNWLGMEPASFVARWKVTGLSEQAMTRRVFDQLYPSKSPTFEPGSESQRVDTSNGTTDDSAEKNIVIKESNRHVQNGPQPSLDKTQSNLGDSSTKRPKGKPSVKSEASDSGTAQPSAAILSLGILFQASAKECAEFRTATYERLQSQLTNYRDKKVENRALRCRDEQCLREIVEVICPTTHPSKR